jgi:phosphatidylglycerophosphatase A
MAPGTAASLLGAAMALPLLDLPWTVFLGATLLLTAVAVFVSTRMAEALGQPDPPVVVIDEIVGMWFAAILLPSSLYDLAAVFLLFRVFDVVKPLFIPRLERLPRGWGIVADDVAAGLLARATWWLLKVNFTFL